jgi:hypothetical protein
MRLQYASSPSVAIERGCSIGANPAQSRQLTHPDPATRVASARFRIIRARFNKRPARAFPKSGHRSNVRNAPLAGSNIEEACCVCLETAALPDGE